MKTKTKNLKQYIRNRCQVLAIYLKELAPLISYLLILPGEPATPLLGRCSTSNYNLIDCLGFISEYCRIPRLSKLPTGESNES